MNKQSASTPPVRTRSVLQAPGRGDHIKGLISRQPIHSAGDSQNDGKGGKIAPVPVAGRRPLSPELVRNMDAYWRAANYLLVGQIYLYDNPLLKKPLKREHIKPRVPSLGSRAAYVKQLIRDKLIAHNSYIGREDLPEVRNWRWQIK